ncbi:MAG: hypothetical protein QOI80_922 [Solirubrobacteraceae bacterium]|nr:hypothetical protein [Solirubrobacteraceae bacterium]
MQITHVITSLEAGGAQHMLHKLVRVHRETGIGSTVIGLTGHTPAAERLASDGFRVFTLGMAPGTANPGDGVRLARLLRSTRPDVVQTWMYHSDLMAGALTRALLRAPVVWGLRGSVDLEQSKRSSIAVARLCARLSSVIPQAVISCSNALADIHVRMGYDPQRIVVIPNGFDLDRWRPDAGGRAAVRAELDLDPSAQLIGLIARWDPQKDHETFARAARIVLEQRPEAVVVLAGNGVSLENERLRRILERESLLDSPRVKLLGLRHDVERITAALDIAVSSSAFGEGFHNVLGEAMACGVPCVATDVGDARLIVADTGRIVPARDPEALGAALASLSGLPEQELQALGAAARRRVQDQFAIEPVAGRYARVYRDVLARRAARRS